jgi:hypothetical protein
MRVQLHNAQKYNPDSYPKYNNILNIETIRRNGKLAKQAVRLAQSEIGWE